MSFAHLANPWILARLVLGLLVAVLAIIASVGAVRVYWYYREDAPPDERTLRLERQSELLSTVLGTAFGLELIAVLFTVLASDQLAGSIRGAMCALGVVNANPWGTRALWSGLAAAASAAAWLGMWRVDARLRRGSLVRTLAGGALLVALMALVDVYVASRFLLGLDLNIASSCCSISIDTRGADTTEFVQAETRQQMLQGAVATLSAAILAAIAWRRTVWWSVALLVLAGTVASATGWLALTHVVSPYLYEAPAHRCPYCLLHLDHGVWGVLALAGLAAGALSTASLGAVMWVGRRAGAQQAALQTARVLSQMALCGWSVLAVSGAMPVWLYWQQTGTLSLFGT